MTYSLRFVPQVEGDLAQGYAWYEFKSAGLGEDFLRAFFASASEISDHPLAWPSVHGAFRRRLLRRFPYAVYFTADADNVVVFGVFHCARDPRAIQEGLKDRKEIGAPNQAL